MGSRIEDILQATLDNEPYNEPRQSRIEDLLVELKLAIETSSGGATIDTLWSDSSGANIETEYVLNGDINDYDVVFLKISPEHNVTTYGAYSQYSFIPALIAPNEILDFDGYFKRYIQIQFNGNKFTVLRAAATDEADVRIPILWEIVGIKY